MAFTGLHEYQYQHADTGFWLSICTAVCSYSTAYAAPAPLTLALHVDLEVCWVEVGDR